MFKLEVVKQQVNFRYILYFPEEGHSNIYVNRLFSLFQFECRYAIIRAEPGICIIYE